MPTITPNQGLSLPAATDVNNVPVDFDDYNDGVENRLVQRYLSSADRAVRNPTPSEGELSYLADANRYEEYTGSSWFQLIRSAYVGTTVRTASAPTFTTTETVIDTLTFTADINLRYLVFSVLNAESSVTNDLVRIKYRWQGGPTLTTGGTQFHSVLFNCDSSNRGNPATLIRDITGLSGQVTVGTTAQRFSGTGTITMFGSADQNNILMVTSI